MDKFVHASKLLSHVRLNYLDYLQRPTAFILTFCRQKTNGGMISYQNVLMILLKNWSKTSSKTDNEKVKAFTAGG